MDASPSKLKRRAPDVDDGEQPEQPCSEQKKRRTLPIRSPPHLHLKLPHGFPTNTWTPQNSPTSSPPPSVTLSCFPEPEILHQDRRHVPACDQPLARNRASLGLDNGQTIRSNEDQEMLDFPVRIPTPMHGSFFLTSSHHSNRDVAMGDVGDSAYLLGHPQYHGHRLPSPISEGGDKLQPFEENGEPMEIVEDDPGEISSNSARANNKASQSSRSSRLADRRIPPAAVFSKGKMMFAMGYRADCEMCRDMVPGHYSHFVRV